MNCSATDLTNPIDTKKKHPSSIPSHYTATQMWHHSTSNSFPLPVLLLFFRQPAHTSPGGGGGVYYRQVPQASHQPGRTEVKSSILEESVPRASPHLKYKRHYNSPSTLRIPLQAATKYRARLNGWQQIINHTHPNEPYPPQAQLWLPGKRDWFYFRRY